MKNASRVLSDELGVPPAPETTALFERIKSGGIEAKPAQPPATVAPKLRTMALPHNFAPFVGRERELTELQLLLATPEARMITLVGAGGMGKTRLAVEVASRSTSAIFVSLATATASDQIMPAFAAALGLQIVPHGSVAQQVLNVLKPQRLLCVIDNAERLLNEPESIAQFEDILAAAPDVKLLVTSREALGVRGEWVFGLDGLGEDAAALFVQSGRRASARWQPGPADHVHIKSVCALVGGMPLGVELAASWLNLMTPAEIANEIERNITFLTTTARSVDERHRSIEAVLDASWNLLTPAEQNTLAGLSVFRSGFTREAAGEIVGATLMTLSSLVSKALLRRVKGNRYDLHELVRVYGLRMLRAQGRELELRDTLLSHLARDADATMYRWLVDKQTSFVAHFDGELDNLRHAVEWAIGPEATEKHRQAATRLISALPLYWRTVGELTYARSRLAILMDAGETFPPAVRGVAHHAAGHMALWQYATDEAETQYEKTREALKHPDAAEIRPWSFAMTLCGLGEVASQRNAYALALQRYQDALHQFEAIGDKWGVSEALIGYARHIPGVDTLPERRTILERSVALKREINDAHGLAAGLSWLSVVTQQLGDYTATESLHAECLRYQEQNGDKFSMAITLNRMAELKRQQRNFTASVDIYQRSLALQREVNLPDGIATAQHNIGHVYLALGDVANAAPCFAESLRLYHGIGNKEGIALALAGIGGVAAARGAFADAVRLLSRADSLMTSIDYYFEPADRAAFDRHLAQARDGLDPDSFALALAEGATADVAVMTASALASVGA